MVAFDEGGNAEHRVLYADLLKLREMKRVGEQIASSEPRIDVLMNNAGAIFDRHEETEDHLERTFALNHMSYFVITHLLRERLLNTPGARVVSTSSGAHSWGTLDFADLQNKSYRSMTAYGRSKLCNILFTRELARRLCGTGVTANCLHPGFVATRFGDSGGNAQVLILRFMKLFALSEAEGAKTMIYLASSPKVAGISGEYFDKCAPSTPKPYAQDDVSAARLWRNRKSWPGSAD